MTNNLENLNIGNKEYKGTQSIYVGNGNSLKITHTGKAKLISKRELHLNNLLRVPQIKKNLISVSQFANDNQVYFEFVPKICLVRDILSKDVLLQGKMHNGLYRFNLVQNSEPKEKDKWCNHSKIDETIDFNKVLILGTVNWVIPV